MKNNLKQKLGLLALMLIMFVVTLDTTITNIALPNITDYFGTKLTVSNWVSTVYVLILSVLMIPAAKLGDQLGRKKVILSGLIIFGFGSFLCSISQAIEMLIIARGLQGVGGAITTPILIPLCVSLFGRNQANKVVGEIGAVAALAAAIGPAAGGVIIHYWTWHVIFLVNIPITIVTMVLVMICFEESYDPTISQRIDYIGITMLSVALFLVTFILLKGYDYGWTSPRILSLSITAIIIIIIFIISDIRKKESLLEFSLFKNLTFTASTLIYFTCGFCIVCSSVVFNFFLENIRGYSPLRAGCIIMFSSIMVMVAMPVGNKLGQQLSFCWPLMAGTLMMATGSLLLTQLTYYVTIFNMIFAMCVLGLGFGLGSLSLVSAVQYIPEEKAGIASGMVNAARQLGTCLGIALLVGMLNHNVEVGVRTTRNDAIRIFQTKSFSKNLRKTGLREMNHQFRYSGNSNIDRRIDVSKLRKAAGSINGLSQPSRKSDLYSLYQINDKLHRKNVELRNGKNAFVTRILRVADNAGLTSGNPNNDFDKIVIESGKLRQGDSRLVLGQSKLTTMISLFAQKQALSQALNQIKKDNDYQLTHAFTKTFIVSTVFLTIMVPVSWWTDRDITKKKEQY